MRGPGRREVSGPSRKLRQTRFSVGDFSKMIFQLPRPQSSCLPCIVAPGHCDPRVIPVSAMAKFKAKVVGGKKKGGLFPKGTPAVGKSPVGKGGKKKTPVKSVLSRITGGVGKAKTKAVVVRRVGGVAVSPGVKRGPKNDLRSRLNAGPTVTRPGGARAIRVVSAIRSPGAKAGRNSDLRASLGSPGGRSTFSPKGGKRAVKGTGNAQGQQRVGDFLRTLGLSKYVGVFAKEEIDAESLRRVTDNDLKSMGVPLGPRKKILAAKNNLR